MANEVRLIDANALIKSRGDDVTNWDRPYAVRISSIEAAPTIDPESLRPKGRWTVIEGEDWNEDVIYQCSECKEEFVSFEGTDLDKLWNYCPECGAKLEG